MCVGQQPKANPVFYRLTCCPARNACSGANMFIFVATSFPLHPPALFFQCVLFHPVSEVATLLLLIVFIAVLTKLCKLQTPRRLLRWGSYQLHKSSFLSVISTWLHFFSLWQRWHGIAAGSTTQLKPKRSRISPKAAVTVAANRRAAPLAERTLRAWVRAKVVLRASSLCYKSCSWIHWGLWFSCL